MRVGVFNQIPLPQKRMKSVLETIMKKPCRAEPMTPETQSAFPHIQFLQRYHPGIDSFPLDEKVDRRSATVPTRYQITKWIAADPSDARFHQVELRDTTDASASVCASKIFIKTVHLLDPIAILQNEYTMPDHPLLPLGDQAWKKTLLKLHGQNNQAYVDAVASYVLSTFRELDLTPHAALAYGSMTGIANNYSFKITEEYQSYRQCRWFWKGLDTSKATLEVERENQTILTDPQYSDLVKNVFSCPFENFDDAASTHTEELDIESVLVEEVEGSLRSFDMDTDSEPDATDAADAAADEGDSESSGSNESSIESQFDVKLNMKSIPVIMICQEAQEGTLDQLMDEEVLQGIERDSAEWDRMWLAWTFQIIAALSFLQKHVAFTHNDLHTNNIVWRSTAETHLMYRAADGTTFSVPTYGRIFSLIDFGRAIFKIKDQLWISDDHWPDHDAGGQYNFGPFYSATEPKISPNPSFDLCRLAISMLEGLYDEHPAKKKGSNRILSHEGTWKVYETVSPLFNLLWSWTLNDDGETLFEDRHGEEKYPGFDLYIQIAHTVHDAVPKEQIRRPVFEQFRYKGKSVLANKVYLI